MSGTVVIKETERTRCTITKSLWDILASNSTLTTHIENPRVLREFVLLFYQKRDMKHYEGISTID